MAKLQGKRQLLDGNKNQAEVLKQKKIKRLSPSDSGPISVKRVKKDDGNLKSYDETKIPKLGTDMNKKFNTFNSKGKHSKESPLNGATIKGSINKGFINGRKASRKDLRKQYLTLKEKRKRKEITHYEIITQAKKIWEELRQEKCPVGKRSTLVANLFDLIQDKLELLAFQHDTSRILQWLLKLGTNTIRLSICERLQSLIRRMIHAKFSRLCVKNMVKYGDNKCREIVFGELQGNVVKLMSSSVSAPIVEFLYSTYGSTSQIEEFKKEFYGQMFKLFGTQHGEDASSEVATSSLNITKNVRADTKANLLQVISKRVPTSNIMHSIILQFLKVCESGDRDEIIDALYSHVDVLVKTKEGAEILMRCCWFTSGKTRKNIVKSVKGRLKELCVEPHGYLFLMALLDSVDDIKMLRKNVLQELLTNVDEILDLGNGWKVIAYLVAYRDSFHFHPDLLSLLKTADTSEFIKKDVDIKRAEILETVMEHLARSISQDATTWFKRPVLTMLLTSVLKVAKGDMWLDAMKTISLYICQNIDITVDKKTLPFIEHSCYQRAIKRIIQNETEKGKAKLSYQLAYNLTEEIIWMWLRCNRGCFLLIAILESKNNIAVQTLSKKITQDMKKYVTKKGSPGEIALNKIFSDMD